MDLGKKLWCSVLTLHCILFHLWFSSFHAIHIHSHYIIFMLCSALLCFRQLNMSSLHLLSLSLLIVCSYPFLCNSHQDSYHQQHSLLVFKSSIISVANDSLANWSSGVPFCNWTGIVCDTRRERVLSLNLASRGIWGEISPSLGNLSFLQSIDLYDNAFHGHIPPQLGNLSRLRYLSLEANFLDGRIPSSLGRLSALTHLSIGKNTLQGAIPAELGMLKQLEKLLIFANKLSGPIPISLSNLSSLTQLDISKNMLIGPVPEKLGLLHHLQLLYLFNNQLSGSVPASLSNCSSLQELALSENMLTGQIPSQFGAKLALLSNLDLYGNKLSGNIPNSIGNCSKLTTLYLYKNKLKGSVPVELGQLPLLQRLDLSFNFLVSGSATSLPLLVALTNCTFLKVIILKKNRLGGGLPDAIGHFSRLSSLDLSENNIGGYIPNQIGNLTKLTLLNLGANYLNGPIPTSLTNLQLLETLHLGDNILEGIIPEDFGKLESLGSLNVSHNNLSGKIPQYTGNNLKLLDMSYNALTGSIPPKFAGLPNLKNYFNLSNNNLEGPLPGEIGKIIIAQAIDISSNPKLNGFIPNEIGNCTSLRFLNLSGCDLQGKIPDSIGNLQYLEYMDLSSNSLSDTIPVSLRSLVLLQFLNLSRNSLGGRIPDSLGYMPTLRYLDISSNSLSGKIPMSFKKLAELLQYLNLSFNNLAGVVDKGLFANRTMVISLDGNNGLCGFSIASLPACPSHESHFTSLRKILGAVGGVTAFIVFCVLLGFMWARKLQRQGSDLSKAIRKILQNVEHPLISYQEIVRATDGFNQDNLLGTSNFGSVYKGILTDGQLIAVKVLNVMNEESDKSFKAECKVLQKARHRNLAKIITTCSNLHFKGLVFEFLSKGSLDKHLYPDADHVCKLGLKELLNIAIDISHAVEYLHYDCYVQIVHCDIKPSNVLLDEDMTAHLTDFGIARLMGGATLDSLTSTINLKGSVGYIAPEYGLSGWVSARGDVYSYGILLLEMLTRKRPTDNMFEGDLNLHKWVSGVFPSRAVEVVDKSFLGEGFGKENEGGFTSLMRIGLLCSKDSPEVRPTMRDVSSLLKTITEDWARGATSSNKLTPSISNLLYDTNTSVTVNWEDSSDIQSSTL